MGKMEKEVNECERKLGNKVKGKKVKRERTEQEMSMKNKGRTQRAKREFRG